MKIGIKHVKKIREDLNLDMIVIFGVSEDGAQHVATHGRTVLDARIAAQNGNDLKKALHWPAELCADKPIKRICEHCDYWKIRDYRNERAEEDGKWQGNCFINQTLVPRRNGDRACKEFEPNR